MLKEQIFWLNRHADKLYSKSKNLYDKYINGSLNERITKRCCNFKLLEKKCIEYNKDISFYKYIFSAFFYLLCYT